VVAEANTGRGGSQPAPNVPPKFEMV